MGKLAKRAIIFGQKVDLEGALSFTNQQQADLVISSLLVQKGRSQELECLRSGSHLPLSFVESLLKEASPGELLKFVEILFGSVNASSLYPATLLPFGKWKQQMGTTRALAQSQRYIECLPAENVRVVLDSAAVSSPEKTLLPLLRKISGIRDDVTLVGPSPREVRGWGESRFSTTEFRDLFVSLRESGLDRLRPGDDLELIRIAFECNLPVTLVTSVDLFGEAQQTRELFECINQIGAACSDPFVWCPIVTPAFMEKNPTPVVDELILRYLAMATLMMPDVGVRRASSRHLSRSALSLARLFGANDFGIGALDSLTAQELQLEPYDSYREFLPDVNQSAYATGQL